VFETRFFEALLTMRPREAVPPFRGDDSTYFTQSRRPP